MSHLQQPQPKRVILIDAVTEDEEPSPVKTVDRDELPKRRLARGFTITVSPPSAEVVEPVIMPPAAPLNPLDNISQSSSGITVESMLDDSSSYDEMLPRRRTMTRASEDYLAPEEAIPMVGLDHTVSRLPSLEDMLADEQLRKLLNTSEVHREVQDMIIVESDHAKYENIMSLVEKSFKIETWRIEAAKDKALIDTLILLVRQRLTASRNPHQTPGADFMPRIPSRSALNNTSGRPTYSRSATMNSTECNQIGMTTAATMTCLSYKNSTVNELAVKSSIHLSILSSVVKLLRNLCLNVEDCQIYLHEHRIIDLLFDHIDMIMEIVYWTRDNAKSITVDDDFDERCICPKWAIEEINGFPRAFIQLITNVVSKQPRAQAHILHYIFPGNLLNAIILSGDADLLFCLLHCLIDEQPTDVIYETFILDPEGVKAIYYLLAYATLLLEKSSPELILDNLKWGVLFMNSFLLRKQCYPSPNESVPFKLFHLFGTFFEEIVEKVDLKSYVSSASKTLRRTASFKVAPGFTGILTSKRSMHEVPRDWAEFVSKKAQTLLDLPQESVIHTFLLLVHKAFELYRREWSFDVWNKTMIQSLKNKRQLFCKNAQELQSVYCIDSAAQNVLLQYLLTNMLERLNNHDKANKYSSIKEKLKDDEEFNMNDNTRTSEIIGLPQSSLLLLDITLCVLCSSCPSFSCSISEEHEKEQQLITVELVRNLFAACLEAMDKYPNLKDSLSLGKKIASLYFFGTISTIEKIINLMIVLTWYYHDVVQQVFFNKKGTDIVIDMLVNQLQNGLIAGPKSQNYVDSLFFLMTQLCCESLPIQNSVKNTKFSSKSIAKLNKVTVTGGRTFMDALFESFQG